MAVVISMLRGVNLGAHNRIQMSALRALYESLKLRDAQTYVQSGNVVFRSDEKDLGKLAGRIENGIERKFGFHSDVILRSVAELRETIARNPFAARRDIHPGKLLVTFLVAEPTREAREKVLQIKTDPEELRIEGREVYIYFPDGMGRSKLSWMKIARHARNVGHRQKLEQRYQAAGDGGGSGGFGVNRRRSMPATAYEAEPNQIFSTAKNSSIVSPDLAISERSVPRATSVWSGIERVAMCPRFCEDDVAASLARNLPTELLEGANDIACPKQRAGDIDRHFKLTDRDRQGQSLLGPHRQAFLDRVSQIRLGFHLGARLDSHIRELTDTPQCTCRPHPCKC